MHITKDILHTIANYNYSCYFLYIRCQACIAYIMIFIIFVYFCPFFQLCWPPSWFSTNKLPLTNVSMDFWKMDNFSNKKRLITCGASICTTYSKTLTQLMDTHIHAYTPTCMHTYIHTHTHTYTHTHACIHTYIHTYVLTYMHTYHTCMHTQTHTYIHTMLQWDLLKSLHFVEVLLV